MSRRRERIYPFRIGVRHGMHECIPYEANDNHDNQTRANTLPGTIVTGRGEDGTWYPGRPGGLPLQEAVGVAVLTVDTSSVPLRQHKS